MPIWLGLDAKQGSRDGGFDAGRISAQIALLALMALMEVLAVHSLTEPKRP